MLQIQKGTEISGKVVLQGNPPLPMDKIRISLRSLDAMPDAFAIIVGSIPVASSGDFSAPDIPPAQYGIQISGLPDTAYVADVQQGGISVFNTGLTTGKQPAIPLEIVVTGNGGIIEGNVRTTDRKPVPGSMVVLVPPVADRRNTYRSTDFHDSDCNSSGDSRGKQDRDRSLREICAPTGFTAGS